MVDGGEREDYPSVFHSVIERWPRSPGQFGGDDKLFPGSDYAASFMLAAITTAGACPGGGDGGLM